MEALGPIVVNVFFVVFASALVIEVTSSIRAGLR